MNQPKILVVDDDSKMSSLLRMFLSRVGGYEVREVNHSPNALKTLREYQPDLIILDVDMPEKDGGQIAAEVRADPGFSGIPLIFLSGLIGKEQSGSRDGIVYLSKPVELSALIERVRRLLHKPALDSLVHGL